MPLAQDRSLNLFASGPTLYHCTTDASTFSYRIQYENDNDIQYMMYVWIDGWLCVRGGVQQCVCVCVCVCASGCMNVGTFACCIIKVYP